MCPHTSIAPVPLTCLLIGLLSAPFFPCSAALGQDEFILSMGDGLGIVDASVTVTVELSHDAGDIRGFHFGVCHEEDLVSLDEDAVENGDDMEGGPSFESHVFEIHDDGWTVASLWCVPCDSVMMPSGDHEIVVVTYTLLDIGVTDLAFCEDLGDPAVSVRIVDIDGDDEVEPETENGSIVIGDNEFLRGDVDSSGATSGLTDALALLRWGFLGDDAPSCLDAADADDNGAVSALVDALRLLNWQFGDGAPLPDPGTTSCEPDPTEDELGCETTSEECSSS